VWQQELRWNTKKWWQHVQLPCSSFGCYKVRPLLLHGLFIAIGYIATENVVANSRFYNAFGLVSPNNIATPLIN
jgi:hypothetical protein